MQVKNQRCSPGSNINSVKEEVTVLVSTRPARAAKTTCVNRLVGIMSNLNDSFS